MNWIKCKDKLPETKKRVFLWSVHYGSYGELCFGYLNEQGYFQVHWHEGQPDILTPIADVTHWAEWPDKPKD